MSEQFLQKKSKDYEILLRPGFLKKMQFLTSSKEQGSCTNFPVKQFIKFLALNVILHKFENSIGGPLGSHTFPLSFQD